jgi:hypothetical protein
MQGTAEFHHEIADAVLPQPDPVFDDTAALPVSHPARGMTGASAVYWPACGLRGWPAAGQLWRGRRVGLRRGRPGGAQGVHARRGGGIRALAWPRHRRACARTEPPPASHPSALSPLNMEAPPRVPEGCNRPMTTVPDVCSPSASGLRLRLRGTPGGDTGTRRGDAGGWARVKSGFIFPILHTVSHLLP